MSDLENFTQQTLVTAQAQEALDNATALIQDSTGQVLSQVVNDVVTLDPLPGFAVMLPELPVTSVAQMQWLDDRGGTGWNTIPSSQYRVKPNGTLYLIPGGGFDLSQWPRDLDTIQVTYTHGYATIPAGIKAVCTALAARLLVNPYKIQSQRTGEVQVVYGGVAKSCDLWDTEQKTLGRYTMYGWA
ncbi:hypothetical protein [Kutzneria albida]|uniref:hypothetical protein n=1 Tax=Kutzneria albida TaxID=43357 RepID=UPI0004AAC850|nr:hypothetical protein [Kutzneria albida]